jgi:hypothetical protein
MSTHTPNRESDEQFSDLDALVMEEIESLDRRRRAPRGQEAEPREAEVFALPDRSPVSAPEPVQYFGEEAAVLQQALEVPPPDEDTNPSDDIFSSEEQAFMTRAVGFLRGRPNADAILGRVWEEVTEGDPQAFFSAAEVSENPVDGHEVPAENTEQPD